ncbi:NlpC/P60 family protein [Clostridium cellulovorans]|uniref:NLP/P60 protein n=1 Tax=Clostridium cellulovorans (strain ATCC 35296 / DSM 3052 / OCM 3 / 743B) TaxID=573061 RepID=D9SNM6_CLOC7|nr:C40 family peptidase [Clostridium cellulovorans]ADL49897.1 NLP/P60 protein [Clostridium cellulovorans 743B]
MNKRIAQLLVAVGLVISITLPSVSTYAVPTEAEVQASQAQVDEARAKVEAAEKKVAEITTEIQKYDQKITDLVIKKQETTENIGNTEADIKKTEEDIKAKQQEVDENQKRFEERMKALYKRGGQNIIEILFDSKNLGELIGKIEGAKKIADHDKKLLADLEAQKQELKDKSEDLETKKKELVDLQQQQQQSIDQVNAEKAKQQPLLAQAEAQRAEVQALLNSSEGAYAIIKAEYDEMEQKLTQGTGNSSTTGAGVSVEPSRGEILYSGDVGALLREAERLREKGIYYADAGTTEEGFDCSGFVQYVYRQCGYNITRTTYTQIKDGQPVEPNIASLRPGDLVFFGDPYAPHHVGMYIGDGMYVHSPETGKKLQNAYLSNNSEFSAARRIIG